MTERDRNHLIAVLQSLKSIHNYSIIEVLAGFLCCQFSFLNVLFVCLFVIGLSQISLFSPLLGYSSSGKNLKDI